MPAGLPRALHYFDPIICSNTDVVVFLNSCSDNTNFSFQNSCMQAFPAFAIIPICMHLQMNVAVHSCSQSALT